MTMSNGPGTGTIAVDLANAQPAACAGIEVTGKHPGDRLFAVERHVDQEGAADDAGDLHDLFPGRVALRDPPRRLGIGEHGGVVIAKTVVSPAIPGISALPPPEKPAKSAAR